MANRSIALTCAPLLIYAMSSVHVTAETRPFVIPRSETVLLQDPSTKRQYEIHIKLPANYNPSKSYPAVYMTDSMYTFQIMSGATRYPINSGKIDNLMLVGISWESGHDGDLSRQRDFTPSVAPGWKDPTGEADKHFAFIKNVVIKYVEDSYSTDSAKRTYVGNSLGGLFGAYILLSEPNIFANYIIGSPSFWYDDQMIFPLEDQYAKEHSDLKANVFIAIGALERPRMEKTSPKSDMVEHATRFYDKLNARRYPHLCTKLYVIEEANHQTAFPTTAIQGIHWLYSKDTGVSNGECV